VYTFWRAVTAIRTGNIDPDPSWLPLTLTPPNPDYPSGHCGYAGAAEVALATLAGTRPVQPISVTSSTDPGSVRAYLVWRTLTQENIDGRVWEGVHFRHSDEIGVTLGRQVGRYGLTRLHTIGL
jgi:hypothetical protein